MSDPGPAPSTPPGRGIARRRYRAGVTLVVVAALVTGSLAAVAGPDPERPSPLVATYVPADGAIEFARQETTSAGRSTTSTVVTESARVSGSAMLNALDWDLATRLIGALGSDRAVMDRSRFWRTITIPADPPPAADAGAQTRVYTLDDDVALAAESGPGLGFTYLPHLVVLPAGVRAGQTWRSTGTAGAATIRYAAEFSAVAAPDECLEVTGTVTYSVEDASLVRKLGRTWCPGGPIGETEDWVGTTTSRTADEAAEVAPNGLPVPTTAGEATRWEPARWRPERHEVVSVDPYFGEGPMAGALASLPPVALRAGLVVQATSPVPDIVAIGPDAAGKWRSRWRAHPGGQILTLSSFGDMTVATTSARTVVGYDELGVRRWTLPTREVVRAAPVRTGEDEIAVAGLDGEVMGVEVATGLVRWRTTVSGDVRIAPVTAAREVVVADGSDTLTGLDRRDGAQLWTTAVEAPVGLASSPTALAVVSESTVGSYDVADRDVSWRRWFPGNGRAVIVAGTDLVVRTREEVIAFSADGTRRWARPGIDVSTDGRLVVVWESERAEVIDAAGDSVTSFAAPPETDGNPARHLVTRRGVFRFDSTWTFSSWTDG